MGSGSNVGDVVSREEEEVVGMDLLAEVGVNLQVSFLYKERGSCLLCSSVKIRCIFWMRVILRWALFGFWGLLLISGCDKWTKQPEN